MATNAYFLNQFISTTLSSVGGIDDNQTTGIILASSVNLDTSNPGIACLTYTDPIDISKAEWITYTSIDAGTNELQGVSRGQENYSAKTHNNGATIAFPLSKSHINNLNTALMIDGDATNMATGVISPAGTSSNADTELVTKSYADLDSLARQAIINGGFTVNQRVYVSNAVLSAGTYGHDRWKAGSGGGDYTFTQLAQTTQITIKAGKSLIQVVEDKNVIGGTYTLSWSGTAQARIGINSATPSGSYASSPIMITGQTAGTVMSVEFNAGTLSEVVLNSGEVALPFMPKPYSQELMDCMRYYEKSFSYETTPGAITNVNIIYGARCVVNNSKPAVTIGFKVTKRIIPIITTYSGQSATPNKIQDVVKAEEVSVRISANSGENFLIIDSAESILVDSYYRVHYTADAEL